MKGKKVIFFDLFLTLVYPSFNKGLRTYELLNLTLEEWEVLSDDESIYKKRATGQVRDPQAIVKDMVSLTDIEASEALVNQFVEIRVNRFKDIICNVEEAILDTLHTLKKKGYKLCLVSNADVIDVMSWQSSPLASYFDKVVFSYEVASIKPNKEIYEIAMAKMQVVGHECVFVGDGGSDELKGAKAVGCTTIRTKHFIDRHELSGPDYSKFVDYVVDDFVDLRKIL